eukprot:m.1154650 g.1154650  ORF g.1154650 m.1154650 type:complete len:204 (+) comp24488_c0_seq47:125-736(+)
MHAYGSPSLNQNITPQDFDSAQYPTMVHLTVKSGYGAPARWMHESCAIGSKLFIRAGGSTVLQQDTADKPALFVAGGIGIAPLHGMLQERLYGTAPESARDCGQAACGKTHLMYSITSPEEFLFGASLAAMAARYRESGNEQDASFDTELFVTQPSPAARDQQQLNGFPVTHGRISGMVIAVKADFSVPNQADVVLIAMWLSL